MSEFIQNYRALCGQLLESELLDSGRWQSTDTSVKTYELLDTRIIYQMPATPVKLQKEIKPNLPWAEDHFKERISGMALNPPPSSEWWPYAVKGNIEHKEGKKFSHTYPERYWPRYANTPGINTGIRYSYGDLHDVINLLRKEPYTRQAYLPVWHPEDTGVVHGGRVPCSIGYHFMIRDEELNCWYQMRSCDAIRHFRDDVYMTVRLAQWVSGKLPFGIMTGKLYMTISSFHAFEPDTSILERVASGGELP